MASRQAPIPYINCVRREIEARRTGKIGPTYDQILVAPAQ